MKTPLIDLIDQHPAVQKRSQFPVENVADGMADAVETLLLGVGEKRTALLLIRRRHGAKA